MSVSIMFLVMYTWRKVTRAVGVLYFLVITNNIGMLCSTGQAFKYILSELDIDPRRYFSIENYIRREMYTLRYQHFPSRNNIIVLWSVMRISIAPSTLIYPCVNNIISSDNIYSFTFHTPTEIILLFEQNYTEWWNTCL